MADKFVDFEPEALAKLQPDEAVGLFRMLLWCAVRRRGIPLNSVTVTSRVNVPDGGVDADVAPNAIVPKDDLLSAGNSSFQIKTGVSATPWQKSWVRKELLGERKKPARTALGEAVRHCLDRGGRFVLVCFGCDPTGAQRRKAVANLRELLKACGYADALVDVWGQSSLVGLIQPFPSIALRLSDRHHLPFHTHEEWARDAEMVKPVHFGQSQQKIVEQMRADLRGAEFRHLRLIGEPGLGKTRLALEALRTEDLGPTVVYVRHPEDFQRSALFNIVLRSDDVSAMTLVIDDCAERDRASIWNALRERSDRVRLITLDHGPETSTDERMHVLQCPPLADAQIKEILAGYVGEKWDLERWAEFCSGSPRVAHAVGDNLRRNPADVLKPPATVPIWDRFIHGTSKAGSPDEAQKEVVLRHVALFHRFGFEPPVQDEAKYVSQLVEKASPGITWSQFLSVVKRFRDRRIIQGKTTLFLVPRALHVYLWIQFWEHYGRGVDIGELLSHMPASLFRWFSEMFRYGHASEACLGVIERLTAHGGPFDDAAFVTNGPGAKFLDELAEAHPDATLRCIERVIGAMSNDDLVRFDQHRQYIVWALEKIAIWQDNFRRAALMLLRLARAENAGNSNNATGTFCSLFEMGFGIFSSSEAPHATRLPVLQFALDSSDPATRRIGLQAASRALADHPYSKASGPERQGMRPLPKLWHPKQWGEVFDAYRATWKLVSAFRQTASAEDRAAAADVLFGAASSLLPVRALADEVLGTLEQIAGEPGADPGPVFELVARLRRQKWQGLSRTTAARLRKLEAATKGTGLASQINRWVIFGNWDDIGDPRKGRYGEKHSRKLKALARSALSEPQTLEALLPKLSAGSSFALRGFGQGIGEQDRQFEWWPRIARALASAGDRANSDLAAGYLRAVFNREPPRWESIALSLIRDNILRHYVGPLVVGSGLTESVTSALRGAVERGEVGPDTLRGFGYAARAHGTPTDQALDFIRWCTNRADAELVSIALETAYLIFCFEKNPPPAPEQPLLDLLTHRQVFDGARRTRSYYEWSSLAKQFVAVFSHHSMRLLDSVFAHFDDHDFVLSLEHSQAQEVMLDLIRREPRSSWAIVSRRLGELNNRAAFNLLHWLGPSYVFGDTAVAGPMAHFEPHDVLRWIDEDPAERAPAIARECPKTFSAHDGGALTRQLLLRYGMNPEVQSALAANFGTEGWSGLASEHHRKKRDKMRAWLAAETAMPIVRWLEDYIDYLSRQIAREEIHEEREF
jgi:hypothetical protein